MKRILLFLFFMLVMEACTPGRAPIPVTIPTSFSPTIAPSSTGTMTPSGTPSSTQTAPAKPTWTETPTQVPTLTAFLPSPTLLHAGRPTRQPTDTPTAEALISDTPLADPTPTLPCESETAVLALSPGSDNIKVGDSVQIAVTLSNMGCVALGLPQYRLYIQSAGADPVFTPVNPDPVVHSLAVAPGQQDSATFTLTASAGGQATLLASASFEVHLGYPGPAYWGSTSSGPLVISVAP